MNKIFYISVEKDITLHIDQVFRLISTLDTYKNWWSDFSARVDAVQKTISFRPAMFIRLGMELMEVSEHKITVKYTQGIIRGKGVWTFRPLADNETRVKYEIYICGTSRLIHWFIQSRWFKLKHTRDIKKLIEKLKTMD